MGWQAAYSVAVTLVLVLLPALSGYAQITDDFDDNDDQSPAGEEWTHYNPTGLGSYTSAGGTYRLSSAGTLDVGVLGTSRASSHRAQSVLSDFTVSVDVLDWDNAANPFMMFLVTARLSNFGPVAADGYGLVVLNSSPIFPSRLYLVRGDSGVNTVLAYVDIPALTPATQDYRLIFEGTGSFLSGALYALSNLSTPIGVVSADDSTYPSGVTGIGVFDATYPAFALTHSSPTDATFDNFSASGTVSTFDIDADGLADNIELAIGTNPLVADTDGDGLADGAEVNTHLTNPLVPDTDADGLTDAAEVNTYLTNPLVPDTDADGLTDAAEVNTYLTNPTVSDSDADGLTDGAEVNTHLTLPLVADTDADGLSDGAEVNTQLTNPLVPDTDGDGLSDGAEVNTQLTNPLVADTDGDGLADGAEVNTHLTNPLVADTDGDGLEDGSEVNTQLTNPLVADTDGDGLADGAEVNTHLTNPLVPDTDADGLTDSAEVTTYLTNPLVPDTDSDGLTDSAEVNTYLTNPLVPDTDADGLTDLAEVTTYLTNPTVSDSDADGLPDGAELSTHLTNPLVADTDGDGFPDGFEVVSRADPLSDVVTPPRLGFSRLDGGTAFSCGIVRNGEILCWGDAADGRLNAPTGTFRSLALGGSFGCALRTDDTIACWGTGSATAPTSSSYVQLAAGEAHVCGLRPDLVVECWGDNSQGQLDGSPTGRFSKIFAGDDHTCALDATGTPVCWGGSNSDGQTDPPLGEVFVSLTAGTSHTCGVRPDASAACWGSNGSGQSAAPLDSFASLSAGLTHTCGVRADGTAVCWGSIASVPVSAPPFTYSNLASGDAHVCGIKTGGTGLVDVVQCWGANGSGQGSPPAVPLPDVATGFSHACALAPSKRIRCWGQNGQGQSTPPPTSDFVSVTAGHLYSCGLKQDGSVDCFGSDFLGRAADQAAAGNPFVQVAAGGTNTCGVRLNGDVTCWGSNTNLQSTPPSSGVYRQVSTSAIVQNAPTGFACAVKIDGTIECWGANGIGQATAPAGSTWQQVSAGKDFACAVRTDGSVGCWGNNSIGQAPAAVAGPFSEVAAGLTHACGLKLDGSVECWGDNSVGQGSAPPGRYARISAADNAPYTCGVQSPSGAIVCFGSDLADPGPPLDLDDDGIEDGGDNCAGFANVLQADSDVDGAGDGCDVCPAFPDPDQIDRDADGVGDACDNCAEVPNANQEDLDADGVGDACVMTAVILQHLPPAPPAPPPGMPVMTAEAGGQAETFDVYVYCPTVAIQKVELGVILPQGTEPGTVSFGPGCTALTCGSAVVGPDGLGDTVDKIASFARPPETDPVTGVRAGTLYFSLRGQGAPDNRLCSPPADPSDPPVQQRVARFIIDNAPVDAVVNLTTEGLSAQTPPMVPLSDTSARVLDPVEYSFIEVDQTPTVFLKLTPAAGDATGRRWQVELDTDLELHRVTFGLTVPTTVTPMPGISFLGCTQAASPPATRRNCALSDPPNPSLGPYVQTGSASFTVGPLESTTGLRTDTLYVSVAGARESESAQPLPALNVPGQPVLLGVVELTTTLPPTLTLEGVGTTGVFSDAYVQTSNVSVLTDAVQREAGYNEPSDFDADSRSDDLDNCPFKANVDQANNGGFLTTTADAYGDVCQCADGDGDGAVFASDTSSIRGLLVTGAATSEGAKRCSVAGGPECDIRDAVILRRALASLGPGVSSVCANAVRSVQLP